ncbi:MAG: perosamine synthetase [Candidatus Promineifilaceae bacterium]|jgi:perosamine synthetase
MMSKPIPYGRQFVTEEDIQSVVDVLHGDWLTCGPAVTRFENVVRDYVGVKHAIAVSNGTAALHLSCLALDVGPGDVGVTSPLTFLASANCVAYCGGTPDFVDIDPLTYCLSADQLAEYIEEHGVPKVVIPVDFAGIPADLPRIWAMAKEHGFAVIEDAAHSIGSAYRHDGEMIKCGACLHSDVAILSFHPVKTVTSGEGGMVLTNDDKLAARVRMFASHGMERDVDLFAPWSIDNTNGEIMPEPAKTAGTPKAPWLYQQQALGFNYRITDIQSALGASQFTRLDDFVARRRDIFDQYQAAFAGSTDDFVLPPCPPEFDPAYHLYVLRFKHASSMARVKIYASLHASGVVAQVHYIPVYLQPWFQQQYGYAQGKCPNAEAFYERCVSLPLFPSMTEANVAQVVAAVREVVA